MAKNKTRSATPRADYAVAAKSAVDGTLAAYAETLGAAMGNLRNHVDSWKGQRKHLVEQLSTMVSDAQALLSDLGHTATVQVGRLRPGRKKKNVSAPNPAGALKPAKRNKRGISEAGRAAISAAQKARWAQYKSKRIPK